VKNETKQICYGRWGDELAPGHESYWEDIATIADWIGYALVGTIHGWRVELRQWNTMHVTQTKEKFGTCRVYCHMASYEQVEEKYKEYCLQIDKSNEKYKKWISGDVAEDDPSYPAEWTLKLYKEEYPRTPLTAEQFTKKCAFEDAQHYRRVYNDAVRMWPQYRNVIVNAADYHELLYDTRDELDKYFDKKIENIKKYVSDEEKREESLQQNDRSRNWTIRVCEFDKE